MKNKEIKNIIAKLKYYKSSSAYRNKIYELGLFGSFANGSNNKISDIDIFLKLEPARMFDLIGIKEDLEKLFHKRVDIVIIRKAMNPYLKRQIANNGIYV
jgi:predicted nucleotidyltransferase